VISTSVPQLFLQAESPHAHKGVIDNGFWSPTTWMARSPTSAPSGYYYSLVGKKFWLIGSSADCTIVFSDDQISSQHAMLLATADRDIYLCDLQSVYGSFVNDRAITYPVLLRNGDRLKIGPLEFEFQYSGEVPATQMLPSAKKTVLLVQTSESQNEIWLTLLKTCGVSILTESCTDQISSLSVEALLKDLKQQPNLIVVDLEALSPNPYEFCRRCRERYPNLTIILTCSSRTDIFSSEKRWVRQQGAVDLLPGFSQKSFFSLSLTDVVARFECLLEALDLPSSQVSSLEPVLRSLMNRLNSSAND
jgi:pSer/pThr/pTyr-binding forkhead associated (FHA) protein